MIKLTPRFIFISFILIILALALPSAAQAQIAPTRLSADFRAASTPASLSHLLNLPSFDAGLAPQGKQVPFEYSDAYRTRAKIHKRSSIAMLPLLVAQGVLGQKLVNDRLNGGMRTAHNVVATSILGLFGLNTVTGVWNLVEASKDPEGKTRRMLHGILMLGADAGFVATTFTGPGRRNPDVSLHRNLAYTSVGLATTGYVIMLFKH